MPPVPLDEPVLLDEPAPLDEPALLDEPLVPEELVLDVLVLDVLDVLGVVVPVASLALRPALGPQTGQAPGPWEARTFCATAIC